MLAGMTQPASLSWQMGHAGKSTDALLTCLVPGAPSLEFLLTMQPQSSHIFSIVADFKREKHELPRLLRDRT